MSDDEDDFIDEVEEDDKDNYAGGSDAEDPPEDFRDIYSANRQKSYQVLEMNEIIGESKKIVKETTDVLGLPSQVAAVALLRHFG
jgi:hypothetical protein